MLNNGRISSYPGSLGGGGGMRNLLSGLNFYLLLY